MGRAVRGGLPVATAALAALALLLASCSGEEGADEEGPGERSLRAGDLYVALGDSYTAGPGLGEETGPTGCGQTSGNYPHLLAERLGLELVDVSCGGADTGALTGDHTPPNGTAVPAQLDAVTSDARLVTLSIGGNDHEIFNKLVTTCIGLGVKDPEGAPCTELAEEAGVYQDQVASVADRIEDAVDLIAKRAPDARIIVVGYPQTFPAEGTCDGLQLARGDYPLAHDVLNRLVDAQRDGAKAAGVEFLDLTEATSGHDICADDPWIAGAAPTRPALPYHPYAEEQVAVADLLQEQLGG